MTRALSLSPKPKPKPKPKPNPKPKPDPNPHPNPNPSQVSLDLIYSVLGFTSEKEAMYWMLGTFACMLLVVAGTLLYQFISRYVTALSHKFGIEPSEVGSP